MARTTRYFGPRWGQTDKWGKYKCKTPTFQNGGLKRKKYNGE